MRRRRSPSALALTALVLAATFAPVPTALGAPVGSTTSQDARARCDLDEGRSTITVVLGGRERSAVVHVPSARGNTPLPLVLDLHGSNSTPVEQLSRSRLDVTAEREGFIVVAPQGAIPAPAGFVWNVPFTATDVPGAPDDEAFLRDLIGSLAGSGCIDDRRVYAAGYSGGGRMVSQFACDNPTLVAAIAPVAGLRAGAPEATAAGTVPDTDTCSPSRGVPVITFNGTADPVNPFDGGGAPYWGYGALAASERWASINGCKGSREVGVSPNVSVIEYRGCRANADVEQYLITGGGHTWPGGNAAAFPGAGVTTQEISANDLMWDFFEQRRTRGA